MADEVFTINGFCHGMPGNLAEDLMNARAAVNSSVILTSGRRYDIICLGRVIWRNGFYLLTQHLQRARYSDGVQEHSVLAAIAIEKDIEYYSLAMVINGTLKITDGYLHPRLAAIALNELFNSLTGRPNDFELINTKNGDSNKAFGITHAHFWSSIMQLPGNQDQEDILTDAANRVKRFPRCYISNAEGSLTLQDVRSIDAAVSADNPLQGIDLEPIRLPQIEDNDASQRDSVDDVYPGPRHWTQIIGAFQRDEDPLPGTENWDSQPKKPAAVLPVNDASQSVDSEFRSPSMKTRVRQIDNATDEATLDDSFQEDETVYRGPQLKKRVRRVCGPNAETVLPVDDPVQEIDTSSRVPNPKKRARNATDPTNEAVLPNEKEEGGGETSDRDSQLKKKRVRQTCDSLTYESFENKLENGGELESEEATETTTTTQSDLLTPPPFIEHQLDQNIENNDVLGEGSFGEDVTAKLEIIPNLAPETEEITRDIVNELLGNGMLVTTSINSSEDLSMYDLENFIAEMFD